MLLMMVRVIRMFMWQVIRHDNFCNVGQNWLSELYSIGCAYVDFDGEGENIDDLIQARLGCRPLWSWVSSSWWGFQNNICNSMQIPGAWERNMGQTVFHVWTGFRKKTELITRLTGGGHCRRRRCVLRLEILQEKEDHQGTGAVGKIWNHERIRMMRMLMIRWRRPRTSRAWWRPRRSPTSWRRNRSRWDWSLIPLDKDKTDSFQMSITTIESRNAKRYNHVICWAPHHLARGPLSLKCGDGLEEDLKVASATSRSPLTQDLKWDQGIGLWDFSNDYGLFKMPWTRILLLSLEIANNWVRITWVSTYSDQIRLICTN